MERHAFAMKVKAGRMNDYRKKLGEIWPELTTFLDRNKVKLSLIHISEPTRQAEISYAVFCLKKKKKKNKPTG